MYKLGDIYLWTGYIKGFYFGLCYKKDELLKNENIIGIEQNIVINVNKYPIIKYNKFLF